MTPTALIISTKNPPRGALETKINKTGIFKKTLVCESGAAAIAVLQKQSIDMIFWAFGSLNESTEWLDAIQINPAWTDLPLLIFTKEGEQEKRLRGLELGACDSVTFVTSTEELRARIRGHLKRSQQIIHLRARRAELSQMALSDPLTGLGNRASFDLRLGQEVSRSRRSGSTFALMLIDLDHFKWFNDCYGHQAGDTILKSVAKAIDATARDADVACRYGGEEFAIILTNSTSINAQKLAGRLHKALAELSQKLWQNDNAMTASIGLTCFDGSRLADSGELISEADSALYQAKHNGRNRTEIFEPIITEPPILRDFNLDHQVTPLHAM
ncbi:MAG: diguanylate cyclase [Geopsychrobacter sp.]|nr:diguanylate cyclase [Geopsychrobacter sp.]